MEKHRIGDSNVECLCKSAGPGRGQNGIDRAIEGQRAMVVLRQSRFRRERHKEKLKIPRYGDLGKFSP